MDFRNIRRWRWPGGIVILALLLGFWAPLRLCAQSTITAPSRLQAFDYTSTRIVLLWKDNSINETGFKIERKTELAGTYAQIATVNTNLTIYRDSGLITGTNYYYRIRATNSAADSSYSNEATAKPRVTKPTAPSRLSAVMVSSNEVDLVWKDNAAGAGGFKIERKSLAAERYAEVGTVVAGVTNYQDTALTQDTRYYYRVRATNSAGDSGYSNESTARTNFASPPLPSAPTNLVLQPISTSAINVSWKDLSSTEDGFKVERKTGVNGTYSQIGTAGVNTTTYQDTGLTAATVYYYRVRATNATGDSAYLTEAGGSTAGTEAPGILAGGGTFSVALKSDGTVWTWGANRYGMGDGTNLMRQTPVQVSVLNSIVAVAGGRRAHTLALKSDGTAWAWGGNYYGQLGDGTTNSRSSPVQITSLATDVSQLAAGVGHSVSLNTDGSVWTWGGNIYGLGDGATTVTNTPIQITSLGTSGAQVAAGGYHTVVLRSDGNVWCSGKNVFGQLGDGTGISRSSPVRTAGISNVIEIAAGNDFTLAMSTNLVASVTTNMMIVTTNLVPVRKVWSWGANTFGQLGNGSVTVRYVPVLVSQLSTNVIQLAAGSGHGVALKEDGTVWTWGLNAYGQLGDGTTSTRLLPSRVPGLSGVVAVTAGSDHTLAVKADGTVWAWGINSFGQLGTGTNFTSRTPIQISTNLTVF